MANLLEDLLKDAGQNFNTPEYDLQQQNNYIKETQNDRLLGAIDGFKNNGFSGEVIQDAPTNISDTYYRDNKQYEDTSAFGSILNDIGNASNEYLGTNFDTTEVIDGKKYQSKNKDFNDDSLTELRDKFLNTPEDPTGERSLYYLRVENDDGSFSYKTGVAKNSAIDRYKNQPLNSKTQILYDKRISDADALEHRVHGNSNALKYRRNDLGKNGDEFGSGYTELYNMDILGLEDTATKEKLINLQLSTQEKLKNLGYESPKGRYDINGYEAARKTIRKRKELFGDNDIEAQRMEAELGRAIDKSKPGAFDRLLNSVDAFQSGAQQLVVGTADLALDALTPGNNTLLDNLKSSETANKFWGYDQRESDFAMEKSLQDWKDGDYVKAGMTAMTSPEVVAQSIPEMLAMFVPGGALTKLGKAAQMAEKTTKVVERAGKFVEVPISLAKRKENLDRVMRAASTAQKATHQVAKNIGLYTVAANQTNNQIDERTKNNNGVAPSLFETGLMFATTTALLATDRLAFSNIIKGKDINLVKRMIDGLDSAGLNKVVASVAKNAIKATEAGGTEFAQEYMQQWGEILNEQFGTAKYGTDIWTQENFDNALKAGIAGLGAGTQIHSVGTVGRGLLGAKTKVDNNIQAEQTTNTEQSIADLDQKNTSNAINALKTKDDGTVDFEQLSEQELTDIEDIVEALDNSEIADKTDLLNASKVIDYYSFMADKYKGTNAEKVFEAKSDEFVNKLIAATDNLNSDTKITEDTIAAATKEAEQNKSGTASNSIKTTLGSSELSSKISDKELDNLATNGLGVETKASEDIKITAQSRRFARNSKESYDKTGVNSPASTNQTAIEKVTNDIFYGSENGNKKGIIPQGEKAVRLLSQGKTSQVKTIVKELSELLESQKTKQSNKTFIGRDGVKRPHTEDFVKALDNSISEIEKLRDGLSNAINNYEADVKKYGAKTAKENRNGANKTEYQGRENDGTTSEVVDIIASKANLKDKVVNPVDENPTLNEDREPWTTQDIPSDLVKSVAKFGKELKNAIIDGQKDIEISRKIGIAKDIMLDKALYSGIFDSMYENGELKKTITLPDFNGLSNDKKLVKEISKEIGKTENETVSLIKSKSESFDTMFTETHEYVHAQAEIFMNNNPDDEKTVYVNSVYDNMIKYMEKNPSHHLNQPGNNYWKTDRDEFLSEALSKPEVIEFLLSNDLDMKPISKPKDSVLASMIAKVVSMLPLSNKSTIMESLTTAALLMRDSNSKEFEDSFVNKNKKPTDNTNDESVVEDALVANIQEEDAGQNHEENTIEFEEEKVASDTIKNISMSEDELDIIKSELSKEKLNDLIAIDENVNTEEFDRVDTSGNETVKIWDENPTGRKGKFVAKDIDSSNVPLTEVINNVLDSMQLKYASNELDFDISKDSIESVISLSEEIESFKNSVLSVVRQDTIKKPGEFFAPIITGLSGNEKSPGSEALGLFKMLKDKDVKVSYETVENILNTMFIQTSSQIKNNSTNLVVNSRETINSIVGEPKSGKPSRSAQAILTHAGVSRTFFLDSIAKNIKRELQIETDKNSKGLADPLVMDKLALGLAQISYRAMIENGTLQEVNLGSGNPIKRMKKKQDRESEDFAKTLDNDGEVFFVRIARQTPDGKIPKSVKIVSDKEIKENSTMEVPVYSTQYLVNLDAHIENIAILTDSDNKGSTYSYNREDIKDSVAGETNVLNSPEKITEEQAKSVNKQNGMAYGITSAGSLLNKLGGNFAYNNMGHINDVETTVHKTDRESIASKNLRIENLVRDIKSLEGELSERIKNGDPDSFYYKFAVWKNNRIGMVSSKLNAQSDSDARFLIGLKTNKVEIDPTSDNDGFIAYRTAIVQSLGFTVGSKGDDKQSWATNLETFNNIIENEDVKKALEIVKEINKKGNTEGVDIQFLSDMFSGKGTHALLGLAELAKFDAENSFETELTMETDAVTSGVMLMMLQVPIMKDIHKWLNKGGFFFKNQQDKNGNKLQSMGEWTESPENQDSYQTIAKSTDDNLENSEISYARNQLKKGKSKDFVPSDESIKKQVEANKKKFSVVQELVGKLVDDNGDVTKDGRNFAKLPLMTFFYGSKIKTIVSNMVSDSTGKVKRILEDIANAENDKDKNQAIEKYMSIVKLFDPSANMKDVRKSITEAPLEHWTAPLEQNIGEMIEGTYGVAIYTSMSSIFQNIGAVRERINSINKTMFDLFEIELDNEIDKFTKLNGFKPSNSQIQDMVESMTDVRPRFRTAEGYATILKDGIDSESAASSKNSVETAVRGSIKSIRSGVVKKEYKINKAGAPIIVIHSLDSSIEMEVPIKFNSLQVFDANVFNLHDAIEGTRLYNQVALDKSKRFSTVKATAEAADIILKSFERLQSEGKLDHIDLETLNAMHLDMSNNKKSIDFIDSYTDSARSNMFKSLSYVEHSVMGTPDNSGGIKVNENSDFNVDKDYNFAEYQSVSSEFENIVSENEGVNKYSDNDKKEIDDIESSDLIESIYGDTKHTTKINDVAGYDSQLNIVENLQDAKYFVYKKNNSTVDDRYFALNGYTNEEILIVDGNKDVALRKLISKSKSSKDRATKGDYKISLESPLYDGKIIPIATNIKLLNGKQISWDYSPQSVDNLDGPNAPVEPESLIKYKKVSTFSNENMNYDIVEISFDNGKTWINEKPDGSIILLVNSFNKRKGISREDVVVHAETNFDSSEMNTPVDTKPHDARFAVKRAKYDSSKDKGTKEYKNSKRKNDDKELFDNTKTIESGTIIDGQVLLSSEKASKILSEDNFEPLSHNNILEYAKTVATWDNTTDDVGFYLNTLKSIVLPALKATQKIEVKYGVVEGEYNVGNIKFENQDGTDIKIKLFLSEDAKNNKKPKSSINQSMIEIYAHELVHSVTAYLLDGVNGKFSQRARINGYFLQAQKETTFEDFLNRDSKGNILYGPDKNADISEAKAKWNYVFANKKGQGLKEFISYGLTNKNFASKLSTLEIKKDAITGDTMFEKIKNMISDAIGRLISGKSSKDYGITIDKALANMVAQINDTHTKRNNFLQKSLQYASQKARRADIATTTTMRTLMDSSGTDYILKNSKNKIKSFGSHMFNLSKIPKIAQEDTRAGIAFREIGRKTIFDERGLLYSIVNTIMTDGKDMGEFTKQALKNNSNIDRKKESAGNAMRDNLQNKFDRDLLDEENASLQYIGIETDISYLTEVTNNANERLFPIDEIARLLKEPGRLDDRIKFYKNRLLKSENGNAMMKQAEGLGRVMATTKNGVVGQLMNANMIARNAASLNPKSSANPVDEANVEILATLTAMKHAEESTKSTFADMISTDKSAIEFFLTQHIALKKKSLQDNFSNEDDNVNKTQTIKGYSKDSLSSDIEVEFRTISDENNKEMKDRGYIIDKTFKDSITGKRMNVWVSNEGSISRYNPGIIPIRETKSRGHSVLNILAEKHGGDFRRAHEELKSKILNMRKNSGTKIVDEDGLTAPVFNADGEIVDLRIMMSKHDKVRIFHRENDGIKTMGNMEADRVVKANQPAAFKESAEVLFDDMEKHFSDEPEAFVFVGEYTKEERARDKEAQKHYEAWLKIPWKMKQEIKNKFGTNGFYVRKKAYRAVIGERDASLANIRLLGKDLSKYHKTRKMIRSIEKWWKKLIALEKVNIVIRTPEVLFTNMVSNTIALSQTGASLDQIIQKQYEGMKATVSYIKTSSELKKLELRQRGGEGGLSAKIAHLKEQIDANPINYLVQEGFLQSVVEDIDTSLHRYVDPEPGRGIDGALQKAKKKYDEKVPQKIKDISELSYLGTQTELFKFFMKSTQYSDLVARYSLDSFLNTEMELKIKEEKTKVVEKLKAEGRTKAYIKAQELKIDDAIRYEYSKNRVVDLANAFINYEEIDHFALKYANDMGLVMFTKFLLGIQRVIWKMIKERPATVASIIALQFMFGDAEDPLDSMLFWEKDPLSRLHTNPIDHAMTAFSPHGVTLIEDIFSSISD